MNREQKAILNATPGGMLFEKFLEPLGVSQSELSRRTGLPGSTVNEIVKGKRPITAETTFVLGTFSGWIRSSGSTCRAATISGNRKWHALQKDTQALQDGSRHSRSISEKRSHPNPNGLTSATIERASSALTRTSPRIRQGLEPSGLSAIPLLTPPASCPTDCF